MTFNVLHEHFFPTKPVKSHSVRKIKCLCVKKLVICKEHWWRLVQDESEEKGESALGLTLQKVEMAAQWTNPVCFVCLAFFSSFFFTMVTCFQTAAQATPLFLCLTPSPLYPPAVDPGFWWVYKQFSPCPITDTLHKGLNSCCAFLVAVVCLFDASNNPEQK